MKYIKNPLIGPSTHFVEISTKHMDINTIIQEPEISLKYAFDINLTKDKKLKRNPKRFLEGEPTIARDSKCSLEYAQHIICGPFKLGEPVIAQDCWCSLEYAIDVLHTSFDLGERSIIDSNNKTLIKKYFRFLKTKLNEKDFTKKLQKYPELLEYALDSDESSFSAGLIYAPYIPIMLTKTIP
jgi:hypothetical protein